MALVMLHHAEGALRALTIRERCLMRQTWQHWYGRVRGIGDMPPLVPGLQVRRRPLKESSRREADNVAQLDRKRPSIVPKSQEITRMLPPVASATTTSAALASAALAHRSTAATGVAGNRKPSPGVISTATAATNRLLERRPRPGATLIDTPLRRKQRTLDTSRAQPPSAHQVPATASPNSAAPPSASKDATPVHASAKSGRPTRSVSRMPKSSAKQRFQRRHQLQDTSKQIKFRSPPHHTAKASPRGTAGEVIIQRAQGLPAGRALTKAMASAVSSTPTRGQSLSSMALSSPRTQPPKQETASLRIEQIDLSGFSTSSWSRTRLGSRVWIYVVLWLEVDEGRGDSANGVVGSHTVRTKVRFPPFRDMFLFLLRLFTLF